MKKIATVAISFFILFLTAVLLLSAIWIATSALKTDAVPPIEALLGIIFAAAPAAIAIASFISFFKLNRLFTSRLVGYPISIVMAALSLGGTALAIRFYDIRLDDLTAALPKDYGPICAWFWAVSRAPWLEFSAGLGAYAAFISSFWGITRLDRNRPLIGAFFAPGGAIAALYLFSIYQSDPANALFSLIKLEMTDIWSSVILTLASALALLLADTLFAAKPGEGRRGA